MQVDRHPLKWGGHLEPLARQRLTCHICLQHLGDRWAHTPWFPQDGHFGPQIPDYATSDHTNELRAAAGGGPEYDVEVMRELCGSYAGLMSREFYKNLDPF